MNEVRATHGGGPAPQIVRAIENVKLALRLRQARGPLTQSQTEAMAQALDAAAIAIERSLFAGEHPDAARYAEHGSGVLQATRRSSALIAEIL